MDWTQIIVAAVGTIGVLGAAWIGLRKGKSVKNADNVTPSIHVGDIGGDANIAGGNINIYQSKSLVATYFTKEAALIIEEASKEVIEDVGDRLEWSSFDTKLLTAGVVETPRGMGFKNAAAIPYYSPHYLRLWANGGLVYASALEKLKQKGLGSTEDAKRINGTLQIYFANAQIVSEISQTMTKIVEGVYLEMDDDKAIQKAKDLKVYEDLATNDNEMAATCTEERTAANELHLHVIVRFVNQIASDNGWAYIVAHNVDTHPERKNKIFSLLLDKFNLNPRSIISRN